ncbi:MAG: YdeI family protein [Flavobacteriaceae bacterium]
MSSEKIEAYYAKEGPFKEGIAQLRSIALKTEMGETLKWGSPVYTVDGKNVLGIMAFKQHFGVWFFNGVFLSDPKNVLQNAQEGKTKAMRHWKFTSNNEIDEAAIKVYMLEAIENQKKGLVVKPERNTKKAVVPELLKQTFETDAGLKAKFEALSPGKQREYCEYISTAKQEKTKQSRLEKITPMILEGVGLNDMYRNC